jgi:tight adherence protein C
LESLAVRTGLPEIESLVRVLVNSERFGTQISASLETFSADIRARRKRSAEEQARRAPVKILFPLVFLILPAFILLTVVPLLVSAFESMDF